MKAKIILILFIMFLAVITYSQQPFCADSSIRIKYVFGNEGASLYNNPDTAGKNIFTGGFNDGTITGLALLKTNWGDSMIWAKRIYANNSYAFLYNSIAAPNGSIVCTGNWGGSVSNNSELLISKLDTNGTVQWIKRFSLSQNHKYYAAGNFKVQNISVANNAIYFNAVFYFDLQPYSYYNVIAKLDLAGNIIWSNGFRVILPKNGGVVDAPVFYNNSIVFASNISEQPGGIFTDAYTVLTKLNDADGSVMESNAYKTIADTLVKGTSTTLMNVNPDNSLSLTGLIAVKNIFGDIGLSDIVFNTLIDNNLNPVHNYYYRNNIVFDALSIYYNFNQQKQHAFLAPAGFNQTDKYFITFDKNDQVQRSRKFTIPSVFSSIYSTSVNLDDKQNLHFLFHYPQSGKQVTEYARISNFAPSGTFGCFGKDTSILTTYPFGLTKQAFTWDTVLTDLITGIDVPYTEDTAIVTKELVCKIVSYCDSVYINGPATACVGQPVRYTVSKNSGCFKNLDWQMDTSFVNIINTEGDSAITISFKKPFTGYLHAAISDCVVKDSFFVTVVPSPIIKITNRDSVLCPGKTITLNSTAGFAPYLWQDGSTSQSYTVNGAGFYKVTGTSYCGIKSADSITVKFTDTALLLLPTTQTICRYDTAFIILPADLSNITWQPLGSAFLNNKTIAAYPTQNTLYTITAERFPNCTVTASSIVTVIRCPETVFVPGAFTPDGNGLNDYFRAFVSRPVQFYRFIVFNRYGQKVFESSNPLAGWDGNYNGMRQNTGAFIWQVTYQFKNNIMQTEKGSCLLLR